MCDPFDLWDLCDLCDPWNALPRWPPVPWAGVQGGVGGGGEGEGVGLLLHGVSVWGW